jgi:hypothetical protein
VYPLRFIRVPQVANTLSDRRASIRVNTVLGSEQAIVAQMLEASWHPFQGTEEIHEQVLGWWSVPVSRQSNKRVSQKHYCFRQFYIFYYSTNILILRTGWTECAHLETNRCYLLHVDFLLGLLFGVEYGVKKSKAIPVTGLGGLYACFLWGTDSIYT